MLQRRKKVYCTQISTALDDTVDIIAINLLNRFNHILDGGFCNRSSRRPAQSGDMFVIMLHYDVNKDGIFDFNDGVTVPDAPVFEGNRLIALRFAAP